MTCPTCGGSGLMYPHPDALVALNCWECGGEGQVAKAAVDAADLTEAGDLDKRIAALPPAARLRVVAQATDPDQLEQLVTEAECGEHYPVRTSACVESHGEPTSCECTLVCLRCGKREL